MTLLLLVRHAAHADVGLRLTGRADGPTVVFAHGFGCDQLMWRYVAPAFEATCRVVLLDHVGAGGADAGAYDPVRHGRLEGYAQDVVEVQRPGGVGDHDGELVAAHPRRRGPGDGLQRMRQPGGHGGDELVPAVVTVGVVD